MEQFVENLWGWEAVMPLVVDDVKWDEVYEVYVKDKYALGMKAFFDQANPYARQALVARLLETARKKGWTPKDPKAIESLAREYVESVLADGASCSEHTCNNPFLDQLALAILTVPGLYDQQKLAKFAKAMEHVRKRPIEAAAKRMAEVKRQVTERKAAERRAAQAPPKTPVKGYEMQEVSKKPADRPSGGSAGGVPWVGMGLAAGIVALLCIGFRRGSRLSSRL